LIELFSPAIKIINKMRYKKKITFMALLFFIPIGIQFFYHIDTIYKQKNNLNQQLQSLDSNKNLVLLIKKIAEYRGLNQKHVNTQNIFKDRINKLEEEINILFSEVESPFLRQNPLFKKSHESWIEIKNRDKKSFDKYSQTIKLLINLVDSNMHTGSQQYQTIQLHYISDILHNKLLWLSEHLAQTRGIGSRILSKKEITDQEKTDLLHLYTLIKANHDAISTSQYLNKIYYEQENLYIQDTLELNQFLNILNENFITNSKFAISSKEFFTYASNIIQNKYKMRENLLKIYKSLIKEQQQSLTNKANYSFVLISLLLFFMFYIIGAFYYSVIRSLKQLNYASMEITKGHLQTTLITDTEDELNDAFITFNQMAESIRENTAFLDGYKIAIDESSIVSKTDIHGFITYANQKFCDISGYKKSELLGKPHNIIRHPDVPREIFKELWKTIKAKEVWQGIVPNKRKDGTTYIVNATIIPMLDANGNIKEYIAVRHDITELEESKELLKKQETDYLTKLYNRNRMVKDIKLFHNPVLIFLNINSFGKLNDFFGSKTGDQVLITLSSWLDRITQNNGAKLYKLHADQFAILSEKNSTKEEYFISFITQILEFIESNTIEDENQNQITISMTAGIAFNHKNEHKNLLTHADIALKQAKKANKKFTIFDQSMQQENNYSKNMEWIQEIRSAINEDRIIPYYQPIINNKTEKIEKYEALVRLIKRDKEVISPFFFLDIAKQVNLYEQITHIMINKSFATFRNLPYEFSINLSIDDINNSKTIKFLKNRLENFPNPQRVVLEIVESEQITDYTKVEKFIKDVKSYGVKIAIDDFGSGYSNFEHILRLDANYLKIDGSLIKNIDKDQNALIIVKAINDFSKRLNRKTIVEFVHNRKIYDIVKALGCDYSQGFYLGEPMQSPKIEECKVKEVLEIN